MPINTWLPRWLVPALLIPLALASEAPSLAQTTNADYRQRLDNGKKQLASQQYAQARQTFTPLLTPSPANAYVAYAHYYDALAAFRNQQPADAKALLTRLLQQYPTWQRADDARYLLANLAFAAADYPTALTTLQAVRTESLKADVAAMKKFYLAPLKDVAALKRLQTSFASDPTVAEVLVGRLLTGSPDDRALAERLRRQFNLSSPVAARTQKRDAYNVAVLFPFDTKTFNPDAPARDNQFALDLYAGIRAGKDQLASEGTVVNLFAYDLSNDPKAAQALVASPELAQMDLLIGPLYAETNRVVAAFAKERRVPLVNPLSGNPKIIQDNPFAYLVQTSAEARAAAAADYAAQRFQPHAAAIFFGTGEDDSLVAYAYRARTLATNGKVLVCKRVGPNPKADLTGITPGHVFVASNSQSVANVLLNALKGTGIPVITRANWLDFQTVSYDRYQQQPVYFIYPDYASPDQPNVLAFKNRYLTQNHVLPTTYAHQGYDLMVFFGQQLGKFGPGFGDALRQQPATPAATLGGFDYTGSNANRFVPLYKFAQSRLVRAE